MPKASALMTGGFLNPEDMPGGDISPKRYKTYSTASIPWIPDAIGTSQVIFGTAVVSALPTYDFTSATIHMETHPPVTVGLEQSIRDLTAEIASLRDDIQKLVQRIGDTISPEAPGATARDITIDEAVSEIRVYLQRAGNAGAYPSDISDALSLEYELVSEALQRLRDQNVAIPKP